MIDNITKQQVEDQFKAIKKSWVSGARSALISLLSEIDDEGYTTIQQLKGAIHTDLKILKGVDDE